MAERDDDFEKSSDFELHPGAADRGIPLEQDDEPAHDDSVAVAVVTEGGGWDDELERSNEEPCGHAELGPQDLPDTEVADESDAELEAIVRRARDAELMAAVRERGLDCWQLDELELALTKYVSSVVRAWMQTGQIFYQAKKIGIKGVAEPSQDELERLRHDEDLRESIANELVMKGIGRFEDQIKEGTGWTPDGGAALTTYFLRNCLFSLKDVLKKHFKDYSRERPLLESHLSSRGSPPDGLDNPEVRYSHIEGYVRVEALVDMLSEKEQRVVRGLLHGLTPQEIVELNDDIPSVGALRAIRQRIRARNEWIKLITGEEE